MAKTTKDLIFAKFDVNLKSHPKFVETHRDTDAVWADMILHSKRVLSDGEFTLGQAIKECWKYTRDEVMAAIEDGLTHGLFVTLSDTHYEIVGFKDRYASADSVLEARDARKSKQSEGGKLGNHRRYHERAGKTDPDCEFCFPSSVASGRVPIGTESVAESVADRFASGALGTPSHRDRDKDKDKDKDTDPSTSKSDLQGDPPKARGGEAEAETEAAKTAKRIRNGIDRTNTALIQRLLDLGHKPDAIVATANHDWPDRVTSPTALVKRRLENLTIQELPPPQPPAFEGVPPRPDVDVAALKAKAKTNLTDTQEQPA